MVSAAALRDDVEQVRYAQRTCKAQNKPHLAVQAVQRVPDILITSDFLEYRMCG